MSTSPTGKGNDAALEFAHRWLEAYREVLRHDRHVRQTEQALAQWARAYNLPLRVATRSAHPLARQLRAHLRHAARAQRKRNQLQTVLAATRATGPRAIRAKLMVALFLDTSAAAPLLRSALRDLRTR